MPLSVSLNPRAGALPANQAQGGNGSHQSCEPSELVVKGPERKYLSGPFSLFKHPGRWVRVLILAPHLLELTVAPMPQHQGVLGGAGTPHRSQPWRSWVVSNGPCHAHRAPLPLLELSELPLVRLDFSCNRIARIPVCYRHLRHLQTILLDNNPLQSPPAQVSQGGAPGAAGWKETDPGKEAGGGGQGIKARPVPRGNEAPIFPQCG